MVSVCLCTMYEGVGRIRGGSSSSLEDDAYTQSVEKGGSMRSNK